MSRQVMTCGHPWSGRITAILRTANLTFPAASRATQHAEAATERHCMSGTEGTSDALYATLADVRSDRTAAE
jgi:hypothetical protein